MPKYIKLVNSVVKIPYVHVHIASMNSKKEETKREIKINEQYSVNPC